MAGQKHSNKITQKEIEIYRGKVLDWYDEHGRKLPWRYKNGNKPNPYHVWLSEIMCQQTTVQAVKAYYTKFLSTWPTVEDLANAKTDDVMAAWAGLGYYARARNLHKCAKIVAFEMGGVFPNTQEELIKLPGIGDYTSAALAAIAFDIPSTVMDGNIERIISRFFMIQEALPKAKPVFKEHTRRFFEGFKERSGDFAQSLMDIGSSICTPKNPKCMLCPLRKGCLARKINIQESLPVKLKKKKRPHKFGEVYWIENEIGQVLFHKRPEKGLLAGMLALPTSSWEVKGKTIVPLELSKTCQIKDLNQIINHVFTHFDLTLKLKTAQISEDSIVPPDYIWLDLDSVEQKLPTVFKKAYVKFIRI